MQSQNKRHSGFGRPEKAKMTVRLLNKKPWPTVHIGADVHGKMMALVQACPVEVGWLSSCTRKGEEFTINDIFVPDQVCSFASTKITKDGEAALLTDLVLSGRRSTVNNLHCWGHSHAHMAVFGSAIDEVETDEFLRKRKEYFIRLIANKAGDLLCSVYYLDTGLVVHNAPLVLAAPNTAWWANWARTEIENKVTQEVLAYDHPVVGELDFAELDPDAFNLWLDSGFVDPRVQQLMLARLSQPEHSVVPLRKEV